MFGKKENWEFQCLKKAKFRIQMFGKGKILEIAMFGNGKIENSNVRKKAKLRIAVFEKGKI